MEGKRDYLLIVIALVLGIFFFAGGVFNILKGFNNYKYVDVSYEENNSIHYKVFLKKNDFFDAPFLEENKTYIISLIDYLNVDFNYTINFSDKVTGDYKYSLEAVIYADKTNNQKGNYWTKKFVIKDEQTIPAKDTLQYKIHENLNIDYQEYNRLLNEFKKTTGVSTDARLAINMIISNDVSTEVIPIQSERTLSLSLPLSELAIEGKVNTEDFNKKDTIEKKVVDNHPKYLFCKVVGIISTITGLLLIFSIFKIRHNMILKDYYRIKLKKILNTYDSIIVNVKNLPNLSNYNIVRVNTFEELIDAHSEVRLPINCYEKKNKKMCYFVLAHDKLAYVYRMSYKDLSYEK